MILQMIADIFYLYNCTCVHFMFYPLVVIITSIIILQKRNFVKIFFSLDKPPFLDYNHFVMITNCFHYKVKMYSELIMENSKYRRQQ